MIRSLLSGMAAVLLLVGCEASDLSIPRSAGDTAANSTQLRAAIDEYTRALQADPQNPELLTRYYAAVERAEAAYLDQARRFYDTNRLSEAEAILSRGLVTVPESVTLRNELQRVSDAKKARSAYRDARVAANLGRTERAIRMTEDALALDPEYGPALNLLRELDDRALTEGAVDPIRLDTGALVTINFQDASFKEAVLSLGRAYGVNMVFDSDLSDRDVSVFAEEVTFQQAFELLLKANRAFYRRVGSNTVIIANDIPAKRNEYSDYLVRTFFVNSGSAETIANTLTTTLGLNSVAVDPAQNTITVRATADEMRLADRLIGVNDRRPAEVVLEVEVLEINRTKSEKLGIDFGSQLSITPGALLVGDVLQLDALNAAFTGSALTLPAATLRFFKQDVDARTLASPRIRAINREAAVFHVGDEVPLRATEIVDSNGQTRTTFERRDIGIKLEVTPVVQLNAAVEVTMNLEVSSLGQNLGTAEEAAYVIGTRTVQTRMLLEDGETAVIGGLIRDEERDTVVLPSGQRTTGLGQLFRSRDGQNTRTDIILTLQPRVVRTAEVPSVSESEFYSGTGNRVSVVNPNDFLAGPAGNAPTIEIDLSNAAPARRPTPATLTQPASGGSSLIPAGSGPTLAFARNSYVAEVGQTLDLDLTAANLPGSASGEIVIRYNPDLITVNDATSPIGLQTSVDASQGQISIMLSSDASGSTAQSIASLNITAKRAGLANLVLSNTSGGLPTGSTLRSTRIVVR